MTPQQDEQVERLFHTALATPPAERAAFVQRECAGDETVRAEVERLLALNEAAGSFLAAPALDGKPKDL